MTSTGTLGKWSSPDGDRWGTIPIPQVPANCAFGGEDRRTLYVTAGDALYAVRLDE